MADVIGLKFDYSRYLECYKINTRGDILDSNMTVNSIETIAFMSQ